MGRLFLFSVPWFGRMTCTGPFAEKERIAPLAAPPQQVTVQRHEIELPASFRPYGLPYEVSAQCAWGSYRCSIRAEDSRFGCERYSVTEGEIVPSDRFPEFRRFWETCARAAAAQVVLVAGDGVATLIGDSNDSRPAPATACGTQSPADRSPRSVAVVAGLDSDLCVDCSTPTPAVE